MIVSQKHILAPKWACLLLLFIQVSFFGNSQQNVSISDAPMTPDASSVLDVFSTSKGLLIPRMTSVQRLAINNPANALMVFDTDSSCFLFFRSTTSDLVHPPCSMRALHAFPILDRVSQLYFEAVETARRFFFCLSLKNPQSSMRLLQSWNTVFASWNTCS